MICDSQRVGDEGVRGGVASSVDVDAFCEVYNDVVIVVTGHIVVCANSDDLLLIGCVLGCVNRVC